MSENFSLIGYVAGQPPSPYGIKTCIHHWGVNTKYHMHSSGWLVFQFEDETSMSKVLMEGPYFINGCPLLLKIMPEFFLYNDEEMSSFPVWVRLHSLPSQLWNASCLSKLLSYVGKPIRTDMRTAEYNALSFARALVEVDTAKDLVHEVEVTLPNGVTYLQKVAYEYLPKFCTICHSIGHPTLHCSKKPKETTSPKDTVHEKQHIASASCVNEQASPTAANTTPTSAAAAEVHSPPPSNVAPSPSNIPASSLPLPSPPPPSSIGLVDVVGVEEVPLDGNIPSDPNVCKDGNTPKKKPRKAPFGHRRPKPKGGGDPPRFR